MVVEGSQANLRVLVIEDNRDFAQIIRDILEIKGCMTEVAFDAHSGLEVARSVLPDMIFCDIGLPGSINGLDFARILRADLALRHIPIIAVSGYTSDDDRMRALDAGFDMIFPKPIKFADLGTALTTFASGRPTA